MPVWMSASVEIKTFRINGVKRPPPKKNPKPQTAARSHLHLLPVPITTSPSIQYYIHHLHTRQKAQKKEAAFAALSFHILPIQISLVKYYRLNICDSFPVPVNRIHLKLCAFCQVVHIEPTHYISSRVFCCPCLDRACLFCRVGIFPFTNFYQIYSSYPALITAFFIFFKIQGCKYL